MSIVPALGTPQPVSATPNVRDPHTGGTVGTVKINAVFEMTATKVVHCSPPGGC